LDFCTAARIKQQAYKLALDEIQQRKQLNILH